MSTDWQGKEREFLTGLEADTGHDLAGWMRRIAAQNLTHRNDIIDWLRQQGFPFARASWLERIHHNAGRPIYIDASELQAGERAEVAEEQMRAAGGMRVSATASRPAAQTKPRPDRAEAKTPATPPVLAATTLPAEVPAVPAPPPAVLTVEPSGLVVNVGDPPRPEPAPQSPQPPRSAHSIGARVDLEAVLAKAKAYRPLAAHLIRAIEDAVPGVEVDAAATHVSLASSGRRFGLVAVSGKDLRLALALPGAAITPPWQTVKLQVTLARPAEGMTQMLVLNDARQVDDHLINLLKLAATA